MSKNFELSCLWVGAIIATSGTIYALLEVNEVVKTMFTVGSKGFIYGVSIMVGGLIATLPNTIKDLTGKGK